jgi:hypothetical protein
MIVWTILVAVMFVAYLLLPVLATFELLRQLISAL